MSRVIPVQEVKKFIIAALSKSGGMAAQCQDLADILTAADLRGHYSHGLNRLEMYCNDYKLGTTCNASLPTVEKDSPSTALVNGNNSLGATVGKFSMNLAIEKSKKTGVGLTVATNSNHYGIAGYYGLMAQSEGLIGMCMTNTSPLQVPTRSKKTTLGTNPISVVAPAKDGDCFALDMATTTIALGKIEVCRRKGESIPATWGCDSDGIEATDPEKVINGGGLLPLGGTELTSGYKGYGLALMVEVFCGILADAAWGPNIRSWQVVDETKKANLGQFFMAVNPENFADGFAERMQAIMDVLRSLDPVEGKDEVLVAGDPERQHLALCEDLGGIPYHEALVKDMAALADQYGIDAMKPKA